ncbi:MAG TPA: AAA-associated domain-containing protein [Candidatus Manganitrophaceae bacterium]|nr:AAA-associated domain-containing protein [Candidatus Manganitrophaceae bacterium]
MQIEPLPQVSSSKVIGLLEYLDDRNGKEDIYKLAEATHYETGELLSVIKMAEMLGLVETPGGDVTLVDLGRKLLKSKVGQRKAMIREQLKKMPIFQRLIDELQKSEGRRLSRESILEELSRYFPHENIEDLFKTVVNWGRYAELLGYSHDTQTLYLDEESFPPPS